ncbi:MAG: class I SAM-dependent methyltransferase [Rhodomicrobium sp.]
MLSRSAKAIFYTVAGPAMAINGYFYRAVRAPAAGSGLRVHLGPGQDKYLPGWINVDANAFTGKCDVWADLRNRLPLRENSVKAMYSHHVIEHLPDIPAHMLEVFRCLRPGGIYRVAVPNGDSAISRYQAGDMDWFGTWPDNRRTIGGRLDSYIMCRGEHVALMTKSYLEELLEDAQFEQITLQGPVDKTGFPELFADAMKTENESHVEAPHTLVMEARKPAA